ncbi:MAG: hypothetical protein R3183_09015 [Oleiphilaceae bacterium]|nr:hypothetical protein [Oleiphilaceae bacterium]
MGAILLNGWSASKSCWQDALSDARFADWQVWDLHAFDDWLALERALSSSLRPGDVLAGWSLGGMLAARYISKHQPSLAGFITFNANLRFVASEEYGEAMPESTFADFEQFVAVSDPSAICKRFSSLMLKGSAYAGERQRLRACYNAQTLPDLGVMRKQLACLGTLDLRRSSASSWPKSIHFSGTHDVLVPSASVENWAALTKGECALYDGGHIPFLGAWTQVSERLVEFLSGANSVETR